ncbi:MAG: hypothetical protein MUD08_14670 [Cytophagales bacterium]|jgi:hypothetical protein|nr:hypothetical protein [Cytophagales bacterium]
MDNFDDLKNLWQQMPVQPLLSAAEMNKKAADYQNSMRRKSVFAIGCLLTTLVFIILVGFWIEPQYVTTRIGIVITIGAIVMAVVAQSRLIKTLLPQQSVELDSRHYLEQMVAYQKSMRNVQTKILSLYFVLLSLGIGLYMFEYVMKMPVTGRFLAVSLTAAWIAFNWFYIRPKQIAKQQSKANQIIEQLENVCRQL